LDWFRGKRPWNQLLRLVGHLPKYSRYWVAYNEDDQVAEVRLRMPAPSGPPPLAAWGEVEELIATLREEFAVVRHTIASVAPGLKTRPKAPKPIPRPVAARQRAERRDDQRKHDFIVSQVIPGG
jgi:hypothetical protein